MGAFATPWWGQVLAWLTAGDHRGAERQAGARPDRRVGRAGGASRGWRSGPLPLSLAGRRRRCTALTGARRRRCWSGSRSSRWSGPSPAWTPAAERRSSTGPRRSGPARWRRSAWPWSTTRPTPRSSTGPSAWPSRGQTRAGPAPRRRHADDPRLRRRDRRPRDRRRRALPGRAWSGSCDEQGYAAALGPAPRARPRRPARRPAASDDPVDLLVVGSHGHGLVRDLLFGQTVDQVRHGLEIPMLIARPGRGRLGRPDSRGRLASIPAGPDPRSETGSRRCRPS